MHPKVRSLVKHHALQPHPEGGFFREHYRSPLRLSRRALPRQYPGPRHAVTSILYLLPAGTVSRWHRITSDEIWHYHLGGPLQLCEISPAGKPKCTLIGPDVRRHQTLQHVVPGQSWFAAKPATNTGFSLVGCVVAPGFEFEDFELAKAGMLVRKYPKLRKLIEQYQ